MGLPIPAVHRGVAAPDRREISPASLAKGRCSTPLERLCRNDEQEITTHSLLGGGMGYYLIDREKGEEDES